MKRLWSNPDYRSMMCKAQSGKIITKQHRLNISLGLRGRIVSKETRIKIGEANKKNYENGLHHNTILGFKKFKENNPEFSPRRGKKHSEETKQRIRLKKLGTILSDETKRKISDSHKGEKAYQWKGGTSEYRRENYIPHKYRAWRKGVFERDSYTCQHCFVSGVVLNAHHIKEWAKFPQHCYDLDNGITLCYSCHRKVHKRPKKVEVSTGG